MWRRALSLGLMLVLAMGSGAVAGPAPAVARAEGLVSETSPNEALTRLQREFSAVLSLRQTPESTCLSVLVDHQPVVEWEVHSSLIPASLMKIVTAATALDVMGEDSVYTTEVVVDSQVWRSVEGGVLRGDIFLVGGGDPVLSTPGYAGRYHEPTAHTDISELADRVVETLKAKGVNRVEGGLVGDDSWYPDRERDYTGEFLADGDAVVWKPSHVTTNQVGGLSGLLLNQGFTFYGRSPFDRKAHRRSSEPTRYAAAVFGRFLENRGIAVTKRARAGSAPAAPTSLGRIDSPPMSGIVARMLSRSDNTTAEMLLKEIGRRTSGSARAKAVAGMRGVVERLIGDLADDIRIVDGSGLSNHNLLTCAALGELLLRAGWGSPLIAGLSVAGERGTLRNCWPAAPPPGQGPPNRVMAKTGYLNESTGLAGSTRAPDGETVTFVMIANATGYTGLPPSCNGLQRSLLNAAAHYTYGPIASPEEHLSLD